MVHFVKDIPKALAVTHKAWGQMVYPGSLTLWMDPEAKEAHRHLEYVEAPVFHLPEFLLACDSVDDAYFPDPEFDSPPLLAPQGELETAPPWPSYVRPAQSRDTQSTQHTWKTTVEVPHRSPVFHVPTADEIAAHLDAVEELCRQSELHLAPQRPLPRVFVPPPPPPKNSPLSAPARAASPACDRSSTPFRLIPSLPLRFPGLFGPNVDMEYDAADDADVSDGTFSDIDSESGGEESVCESEGLDETLYGDADEGLESYLVDCIDEWMGDDEATDVEAEVLLDAESEVE
ncbi:hypothetical protein C8R46DRAFT_1063702 [Mycena filopes]|nr:hypothetical protein C8R46DRAFT_1063702 [Mycena filopes]